MAAGTGRAVGTGVDAGIEASGDIGVDAGTRVHGGDVVTGFRQ